VAERQEAWALLTPELSCCVSVQRCTDYPRNMAGAQRRLQAQWQLGDVLEDVRHEWRNPKKLIGNFNGWVASQPPYIEAIVATLGGGGQVRRRRESCSWQQAQRSLCLWCTAQQQAASALLH